MTLATADPFDVVRIPKVNPEGPRSSNRSWMDEIACADTELEFVPNDPRSVPPMDLLLMREVCEECPVKRECLEYAFEQPSSIQQGVYAGTTPQQRRRLKDHPDRIERLLEEAWA